ncbi:hypothetical protein SCA6_006243 [Theobroma cacao]
MSGATTAAYLARRAAQKERVRILYRRALKDTLNWAVHRHLFYRDASDLREKFEANKHMEDLDTIDRMIADGEATYNKWRHPDPYIDCLDLALAMACGFNYFILLLDCENIASFKPNMKFEAHIIFHLQFLGLLVVPSLLETLFHHLGLRLHMIMVEKTMTKTCIFSVPINKGLEDPFESNVGSRAASTLHLFK